MALMAAMAIKDHHPPFAFRLFICIVVEVDEMFHAKVFN
jgi:hypothetical protein